MQEWHITFYHNAFVGLRQSMHTASTLQEERRQCPIRKRSFEGAKILFYSERSILYTSTSIGIGNHNSKLNRICYVIS
jgi:hypothetical protein